MSINVFAIGFKDFNYDLKNGFNNSSTSQPKIEIKANEFDKSIMSLLQSVADSKFFKAINYGTKKIVKPFWWVLEEMIKAFAPSNGKKV